MATHVELQRAGAVCILRVTGTLILGPSLAILATRGAEAINSGAATGMVVHLRGVHQVDSSGLGELVALYTYGEERNCRVVLAGVEPNLHDVIRIARLDALLKVYDGLEPALASFGQRISPADDETKP